MHQTRDPRDAPHPPAYPQQQNPQPPMGRYGPPPEERDNSAVVKLVALGAVVLALGIGLVLKVGGVGSGARPGVPDDTTARLMLVQSAWKDTANGREFVWGFHASGELNISTWDEEAEERISANGAWKIEKGHLHYDIHYSDDEEWIRTGSRVEKLTAFGVANSGDIPVMGYEKTSGTGGPVGQTDTGSRRPAWD